jgi:hypothetical protein
MRVMKTVEKKLAGNPYTIEKRVIKVLRMELSYLMLSSKSREECKYDHVRCDDPSNDKPRVMKILGKNI